MTRGNIALALVLGMVLVVGCDDESGDPEIDQFFRTQLAHSGDLIDASATGGTWLGNGLENPDVSGLDPVHGLNTGQGLSTVSGLLMTPEGRNVARYVVECALAEGDTITKNVDGELLQLDGVLGLAPEWKTSACDLECQEWVSACLLARTNVTGQSVDIWITGTHPNVGLGLSADFPQIEASFYGNLFQDSTARYFCRGSDDTEAAAYANGRTCTTDTPEDCGFMTFGDCFQGQRCVIVDGTFPTECADGNNANQSTRHRSLTTYVSIPEGWEGW